MTPTAPGNPSLTPTQFTRALSVLRSLVKSCPEGLCQMEADLLLALATLNEQGVAHYGLSRVQFNDPAYRSGDVFFYLSPETEPEAIAQADADYQSAVEAVEGPPLPC